MQKRRRQIAAWWESLDTEADNLRVNPQLFKSLPDSPYSVYGPSSDQNEKLSQARKTIAKVGLITKTAVNSRQNVPYRLTSQPPCNAYESGTSIVQSLQLLLE